MRWTGILEGELSAGGVDGEDGDGGVTGATGVEDLLGVAGELSPSSLRVSARRWKMTSRDVKICRIPGT